VEVEEEAEGLVVHGDGRPPLGGAAIATEGDHRVAMAHLVLGLAARRAVTVIRPT
jgi:3-phosphoshikimate 1-carboxyvinyltransferase